MQIILKEDVDKLGQRGDVVKVRAGFGRNYLIPRGLAAEVTPGNVKQLQHEKRVLEIKQKKERVLAESSRTRIETTRVSIARKTGEGDVLFGSVTNADIAEALALLGVVVDKRKIQLTEPIKALGEYPVKIKLMRDVAAEIKVTVVREG